MDDKYQKTQGETGENPPGGHGDKLTEGTPEPEALGPDTNHMSIPTTTEEVVAQVPSEVARRELLAGATIGYRIVTFAVILVFSLSLLAYGLFRLTHVLELFVIGIVIAMAINPAVRYLEKRGVPRIMLVLSLLLVLASGIFAIGATIGPPFVEEATSFATNFSDYTNKLQVYVQRLEHRFPNAQIGEAVARVQAQGQQQLYNLLNQAGRIFTASVATMFDTILVIFVVVFLLLDPDPLIRGVRSLMPDKWQPEVQRIGMLAVGKVEAWIQGSLLLMLSIGVVTTLALWYLKVPYALLWGVLAGFLEIVPTLGPVIAAIPPTLVGLTISPTLAVKVLAAEFLIQQIEGNLLVPWIMSNKVRLHPITLLFFLLAMAQLLGVFGALIATPLAAVLKVLYMELYYRRIHGTLPEDEAEDPIRLKVLQRFAKRTQIGEPPGPPAIRGAGEAGE